MSKARAQVAAFSPAPVCASSSDLLLAAGCSAPDHTLELVLPLRTAVCDRPASNVCTDGDQVNALRVERDGNRSTRGLRGRERPEWTSPRRPLAGERPPGTDRYGVAPSGPVAQCSAQERHNRSVVGSIPTGTTTSDQAPPSVGAGLKS